MLHFTKKTIFFLVALNLLTSTTARAATIYKGELGTMWDRADTTSFNNSAMNSTSADDQRIRAPLADPTWHLSSHLSGKPTGAFFMQKGVTDGGIADDNVARQNSSSPDETSGPLPSPSTPVFAAVAASDIAPEQAGNEASVTHSSPLGPIPGPSLKWLFIGALVALVGISRGTRGIHESV